MSVPTSSKSVALEDNGSEDEGVEHLYPIQNLAVLYDGESADEDSMQNPGDLLETEMLEESQETEGVVLNADDTGEVFDENSSSNQGFQNPYIEDFLYRNVDDTSNSNNEEGKGSPLSRFPSILKAVEAAEYDILQVLYQLLYQRSAWDTQEILAQRILEFSGFEFSQSNEEYYNREMMLQTQPNDILMKLAVLLGLNQGLNSQDDLDKARPGLIKSIMTFLFKPCKRTRKRVHSPEDNSNNWKLLPTKSSCGCRNNCFKKFPKQQRQIILDYIEDLSKKGLLDSYLVNMIKKTQIPRRPGQNLENVKKLKEVHYSYSVWAPGVQGTKKLHVCKGAFTSIYNLTMSKMNNLQNKMKSGRNLPKEMDIEDFPPMPVYQPLKRNRKKKVDEPKISHVQLKDDDDEEEEEDTTETSPAKKRRCTDEAYEPSDSPDAEESEDNSDSDFEETEADSKKKSISLRSRNSQKNIASQRRTSKYEVKNKKENVQLKDLSLVVKAIDKASKELLVDIHFLLYLKSADENNAKERILDFSGFPFEFDSEEYDERKEFLQRMSFKMVVDVARSFSLAIGKSKEEAIDNILSFLLNPDERLLRISATMPVSLSDVELDDIEGMSDDSDVSITCEVVEKKVECIDILSSEESDGESKESGTSSSSVKVKIEMPKSSNRDPVSRAVYPKPNNGTRALKDYDTIKIFINSYPHDYLIDIYALLFMRPLQKSNMRAEILEFNGFSFDRSSIPFLKRKQLLDRMLYNSVRRIYNTLIYKPVDGRVLPKPQMVSEILEFLMELPHPNTRRKAQQEKASSASVSASLTKSSPAPQPSQSTQKLRTPPPPIPLAEVSGLKSGMLSDLKRVFQRVACFPCEYLIDVHRLLFMTECEASVIRQNIFAFRGFPFAPDSQEFKQRKNYLEYLTFHSLRKISSVLTTKSVDLRNSTKHELVTHLAEVLAEYCDVSAGSKSKISGNNSAAEMDNSVVENIVVTPLIDPSITGSPSSEMSSPLVKSAPGMPKGVTITESPLKIIEAHSVVPENGSKGSSSSPCSASKQMAIPEESVAQKLEQCQQVYGTTVSLIPSGTGPAITGIVFNSSGIVPQAVQFPVNTTVSPQIITSQVTNLPVNEKYPSPSDVLQKDKPLKQNACVTSISDDEDCDKPLSALVGYPIDSVLEKHVEDIVKNSDLQSITINGVIKKISDMYPKFDLSYRKEFLKSTVRSLLYRLGQEKSDPKRDTDSPDCSVTTTENLDSDSSKSLECQEK